MRLFYTMAKLILTEIEVEEILTEVITGKRVFYYNGNVMGMKQPDASDRDSARIIYVSRYKELESFGVLNKDKLKVDLLKGGYLESDFFSRKIKIKKDIETILSARNKTGSKVQLAGMDAEIRYLSEKLAVYEEEEELVMMNSVEHGAESSRMGYLISRCTLFGLEMKERYWKDYPAFLSENDHHLLNECKKNFREIISGIPANKIRAIARSEEWKKRWEISKKIGGQVFDGASSNWDKNKIELCYWTNFYDNIISYLNLDNPGLLEDDDELFELLRMKRSEGRKSSSGNGETVSVKSPYKIRYDIQEGKANGK